MKNVRCKIITWGESVGFIFFNHNSLKVIHSCEAVKIDFNGQDSYIHLRYGIVSGFLT